MASASQPAPSSQPATPVPVQAIVALVANGMTAREILQVFPELRSDDIRMALVQAAEIVTDLDASLVSDDAVTKMIREAQQNSGLSENEAMELAVSEVSAYREEKAWREK